MRRLTDTEKVEACSLYETGKHTFTSLASRYGVSPTAMKGLLNRRGYVARPAGELTRKYILNEAYFDEIEENQAYMLGFLWADGYHNTQRNTIALSLAEKDREILEAFGKELETDKPLQFVQYKNRKCSNQYRLNICSKRISQRMLCLGLTQAKTFTVDYPKWVDPKLHRHFIRGYFDGDGYASISQMSLVGTEALCVDVSALLKKYLDVNSTIEERHPERKTCIRTLRVSGRVQCRKVYAWLYVDAKLALARKKDVAEAALTDIPENKSSPPKGRMCSVLDCSIKHHSNGFCRRHNYQLNGGAERRRERYVETGV